MLHEIHQLYCDFPKDGEISARIQGLAAVAQLDRVLGYEPRGRGFNSCQPHHNICVIKKQLRNQKFLGCFFLSQFHCDKSNAMIFNSKHLSDRRLA